MQTLADFDFWEVSWIEQLSSTTCLAQRETKESTLCQSSHLLLQRLLDGIKLLTRNLGCIAERRLCGLRAALAHQNDFDVCWAKGSVSELIFDPLVSPLAPFSP